jgi:hypothetical protein
MELEELGPAERLAAGAIGEPGQRRFYLAVTASGTTHTFPCEKNQVGELAQQGLAILMAAGIRPDQEAVDRLVATGLEVEEPEEPRFRIGSIGIGVGSNGLLTMTLGSVDENDSVSFVISAEQFQAMAVVAIDVVAAGRPICPRCGLPEDPTGHNCPWVNGHHPPAT